MFRKYLSFFIFKIRQCLTLSSTSVDFIPYQIKYCTIVFTTCFALPVKYMSRWVREGVNPDYLIKVTLKNNNNILNNNYLYSPYFKCHYISRKLVSGKSGTIQAI